MKKFIFICFVIWFFIPFQSVFAADFKSDYKVEYSLRENKNKIISHVKFTVDITNLRSDLYVKKLTFSFPSDFTINNLTASDNNGSITAQITSDNNNQNLALEFSEPKTGRESINTFYLEFDQDNLVQKNGNIYEIMLPTLNKETRNNYQVILYLPQLSNKKISLSKPAPDLVTSDKIVWNNPTQKTIYAVIGDRQYYSLKLSYHLNNPKIIPVYTDIVFPPDTLYQKTYITSISPKPSYVYLDNDGNYLGRYIIKPKENLDVYYNGFAEIFILPRDETIIFSKEQFESQKKYLLNPDKNWEIKNLDLIKNLSSISDIYSYTVNQLTYDYNRDSKNSVRLGADQALKYPNKAVCVEFSDVFIALAREKGIYSREIQGFGFSENPRFRPLSLASDVLHSWPEYYDNRFKIWVPVDPTWENTSGIDYFSSFDFNHIVFAIHGKKSNYPLPAGMYKVEETKDIIVKAVTDNPQEQIDVSLTSIDIPTTINDHQKYLVKFSLINNSNVYLWSLPIKINSKVVRFDQNSQEIAVFAPFEKKDITFTFNSDKITKKTFDYIQILLLGNELVKRQLIVLPYYYDLSLKFAYVILTVFILFIFFSYLKKKK